MLLKLKKGQSVKLKISIVFIWLVALMILLNVIYDSYLMYVDEYEYPAFSLMSPYMNYVFMGFGVLLAIGLLLKSKVARYILLLFAYFQIVGIIYCFLMYGRRGDIPLYILFAGMGFYVLYIYLLSHNEILKVFKIKHLKWEIVSYFILSMVLYLLFIWYINSMIDNVEVELPLTNSTKKVTNDLRHMGQLAP